MGSNLRPPSKNVFVPLSCPPQFVLSITSIPSTKSMRIAPHFFEAFGRVPFACDRRLEKLSAKGAGILCKRLCRSLIVSGRDEDDKIKIQDQILNFCSIFRSPLFLYSSFFQISGPFFASSWSTAGRLPIPLWRNRQIKNISRYSNREAA